MPHSSSTATSRARVLRRNLTDAERVLWRHLRNRQLGGSKFVRQCPIGPYITDFLCRTLKLVIEVDGSQHTPEKDAPRTAYLEKAGYTVIRVSNRQVLLETDGVLERILDIVERRKKKSL